MNSKDTILNSLRGARAEEFPNPDLSALEASAIKFENPLEKFTQAVKAAGGIVVEAGDIPAEEKDSFTVEGVFGVAENGAVWIEKIPEGGSRRDLFIHEQLVILLDKAEIVNNMHEAYLRLGECTCGYGIFISGPSKTADIEQALVFGAHGARSVVVAFKDVQSGIDCPAANSRL